MRLLAVVAVLAIVLAGAAKELSAGSSSSPAHGISAKQGQSIAGQAQQRLNQSEQQGRRTLDRAMSGAGR